MIAGSIALILLATKKKNFMFLTNTELCGAYQLAASPFQSSLPMFILLMTFQK
jgi:hypothetical protein